MKRPDLEEWRDTADVTSYTPLGARLREVVDYALELEKRLATDSVRNDAEISGLLSRLEAFAKDRDAARREVADYRAALERCSAELRHAWRAPYTDKVKQRVFDSGLISRAIEIAETAVAAHTKPEEQG